MKSQIKWEGFQQFYLYRGLLKGKVSQKRSQCLVKGCMRRKSLELYASQKHFLADLQTLIQYDTEHILKQLSQSRVSLSRQKKCVLIQCQNCGEMKQFYKFCTRCQQVHYCSEVCEMNSKITHEKSECRVNLYPKIQHATIIQLHIGSDLGMGVDVYFQHEARMSSLLRGEQFLEQLHSYLINQQIIPKGYSLELGSNSLKCSYQTQKDYPTLIQKVEFESASDLKIIYEKNQMFDVIDLYLLSEGAILFNETEQVHNNHIHFVYLYRIA